MLNNSPLQLSFFEKSKVGVNKTTINPSSKFNNHTKNEKLRNYLEGF